MLVSHDLGEIILICWVILCSRNIYYYQWWKHVSFSSFLQNKTKEQHIISVCSLIHLCCIKVVISKKKKKKKQKKKKKNYRSQTFEQYTYMDPNVNV